MGVALCSMEEPENFSLFPNYSQSLKDSENSETESDLKSTSRIWDLEWICTSTESWKPASSPDGVLAYRGVMHNFSPSCPPTTTRTGGWNQLGAIAQGVGSVGSPNCPSFLYHTKLGQSYVYTIEKVKQNHQCSHLLEDQQFPNLSDKSEEARWVPKNLTTCLTAHLALKHDNRERRLLTFSASSYQAKWTQTLGDRPEEWNVGFGVFILGRKKKGF